jgi:hypothetical protein
MFSPNGMLMGNKDQQITALGDGSTSPAIPIPILLTVNR